MPDDRQEIEVWVVIGDDHDYDAMSQWLVGAYETEAEAHVAAREDCVRYWKENKIPKKRQSQVPNHSVENTILRQTL